MTTAQAFLALTFERLGQLHLDMMERLEAEAPQTPTAARADLIGKAALAAQRVAATAPNAMAGDADEADMNDGRDSEDGGFAERLAALRGLLDQKRVDGRRRQAALEEGAVVDWSARTSGSG
ncbi:MAG TPA: hypothetical protein VGB49_06245 [Caulobacteraceae bacterium]|jgi:hypothetical protein